ncbi:MAG: iron hydrogenase small subunit [Dehalococcoidales bacterium]|nr:iron hydrogenase small subunit [Dehalococcoidales bacterium]
MVELTIDGKTVQVPEGTTILEAARQASVNIPHLCYVENVSPDGACGLCVVSVEGERSFTRSCAREATNGMVVHTNNPELRNIRRTIIELLMARHTKGCFSCERNQDCELLQYGFEFGVDQNKYEWTEPQYEIDDTSPAIIRDPNKCIRCGRCTRVCNEIQTVGAIDFVNRGMDSIVTTFMDCGLGNSVCINCGQCIHVCPVGAIKENSSIAEVWKAIGDPTKHVVVQEAPAVRVALGEDLGLEPGTLVGGKMYAALKRMGFDAVFDTNFTADLTIMEEGSELVRRIKEGDILPQFTSCCPGWVKFAEQFYPDLLPNISSCKSPQQMFGALVKTYYAEVAKIDPASIVSVSVMPCTAKKFECLRPEMNDSGYQDVDYVLTTRELSRMIREAGIDFKTIHEEKADSLMAAYTGAATIFGATGGVMEAAVRTAYKVITGDELEDIDIMPLRGMEGIKTATVKIGDLDVNVAVAHGLGNARHLLDEVRAGKSPYHFIEIMACPGGCVGGGGQPHGFDMKVRTQRLEGLYDEDAHVARYRKSHENPAVIRIYQNFLGEPLGEKSHHLLHTRYYERECSVVPEEDAVA